MEGPKFKNHIERLKFKIREMAVKRIETEALLKASEDRLASQQHTIDSNALLLQSLEVEQTNVQAEKVALNLALENNGFMLQTVQAEQAALQCDHATVQVAFVNSGRETREKQAACDVFEAQVTLLRERNEVLMLKTASMKHERRARKKKESNAKRSVLKSFQWREQHVDASVLRGAVAFWGATPDPVEDVHEDKTRMSNKARQNILKVIVEQGFNGELYDEMEKHFVQKKRFKVFALMKKSDLESKFGGEAVGSISHCEEGHTKHMRGLMPGATSIGNMQRKMNRRAAEIGLSSMPDTKIWCWGDSMGNGMREGVHRYIKAVYYDKWDTRVTTDDPYVVVLTGDLARVSLKGKFVTLCGAKECDRRLKSQKQTVGHQNNMNQSRTLYVPAAAGYVDESDLMPYFEQLLELFVEVEQQKYIIVDGKRYENVFIKVLVVADMMFLHKFTGRGGCCYTTTHFCMFCSCMSKFRHEGEPGGCDQCRLAHKVYDEQGFQICMHHDHVTPEKKARQLQRQAELEELLRGKMPPRKKPVWEDLTSLQQACLDRCVPGSTTLDGRLAYKPKDLEKIPKMTIAQCNAWLDQRCEGFVVTYTKAVFCVCV